MCMALTGATSCVDILEKPQGSDITLETIFSNRQYAEGALYDVYFQLVPRVIG